jgi:rod shape-determining protein MreD
VTIYLVIPLLLVAAILQTSVVPHLAVWGVFPDLPLLIVVNWSLVRGAREGIVWGFVAGVAMDLLSGAPFGAATLSLMVVGLLSGLASATVVRARFVLPPVTVFLATLVYDLVFLSVVQVVGHPVEWGGTLLRIALPSALLNAVLTPPLFWITRTLDRWIARREMEW